MPKNEAERQKSRTKQSRQSTHSSSPTISAVSQPENVPKVLLECAQRGHIDQIAKILECSQVSSSTLDEAFLLAAEHGHLKIVAFLADKVSSPFCCNVRGESGLCLTARNGYVEVAIALLKLGLPIDTRSNDGITPLYAAVEYNQEEMGFFLLDQKADVNATDAQKNSVLHVAASNGFAEVVLMVLKAGASTSAQNAKDETPLEVAKNADICRVILEFHAGYHTLQEKPSSSFPSSSSSSSSSSASTSSLPSPETGGEGPALAISPFRELPPGPASYLFWTAMGVGKDSYMFQNFGVYPFDRLNDTERIIALTEVAEAMSGYKMDLKCNILNESALYAVFALMKARIKKELDDCEKVDDIDNSFLWRKRVLEAYEQVYNTNGALAGLSFGCWKRSVWNTVVNLLARSLFGESFWEKKRMFLSLNALERLFLLKQHRVGPNYFVCKLPSTASIEIQLTFKKLITMSKTFLCDEPVRPSGCFCQDCIAEFEVPLTFKLQFLEEAAEEKRKVKKSRKVKAQGKLEHAKQEEANRCKLDELVLVHRKELKHFWSAVSIEEKWCLTEMSTTELSDIIATSTHWETLRAALESYAKYAWEEDLLELTEECVTIADDMCEEKGMLDMLEAMLNAVETKATPTYRPPTTQTMTEDEWDKIGRQMLEKLVLAEFARKIAAQYVLKKQESRAQQVALELELELLQEEEQQIRDAEKKARANKKKRNRQRKKNHPSQKKMDGEEGDEIDEEEANGVESNSEGADKKESLACTTTNATTTTSAKDNSTSPKKVQRKLKQDSKEKELKEREAIRTAAQIVAVAKELENETMSRRRSCTSCSNLSGNSNGGSSSNGSSSSSSHCNGDTHKNHKNDECTKDSKKEARDASSAAIEHVITQAMKEATKTETRSKEQSTSVQSTTITTTTTSSLSPASSSRRVSSNLSSSCSPSGNQTIPTTNKTSTSKTTTTTTTTTTNATKTVKKDKKEGNDAVIKEILSETVSKVVEAVKKGNNPTSSSSSLSNTSKVQSKNEQATITIPTKEKTKEGLKEVVLLKDKQETNKPNESETTTPINSESEREESEKENEEEEEEEEENDEEEEERIKKIERNTYRRGPSTNNPFAMLESDEDRSSAEEGDESSISSRSRSNSKNFCSRVPKQRNKRVGKNLEDDRSNNNSNSSNNNSNNSNNSNNNNKKYDQKPTLPGVNGVQQPHHQHHQQQQHSSVRLPFKNPSSNRVLQTPFNDPNNNNNNNHTHLHPLSASLHPYLSSFPGNPLIPMILPRHNTALAAQFIRNNPGHAQALVAQAQAVAAAHAEGHKLPVPAFSYSSMTLQNIPLLSHSKLLPNQQNRNKSLASSPLLSAKPPSNSPLITPTPSLSSSSSSSSSTSSASAPLLRTPIFPTLATSISDPPLASALRLPLPLAPSRSNPCQPCSSSSSSSSAPFPSASSSCASSSTSSSLALPSSLSTTTTTTTPTTSPAPSLLATPILPTPLPSLTRPSDSTEWDQYKDGMMFMCSQDTYRECIELSLMGVPRQHSRLVRTLKPRVSALFLFNISDRCLRGIYEATCQGQDNINEHAWAKNKQRPTPYPSQIEFKVIYEFEPIPESSFRHLFSDNSRIRKLDLKQTQDLIGLFRSRAKSGGAWNQKDKSKPNLKEWPALGEEESSVDFSEEHVFTREYLQARKDSDLPRASVTTTSTATLTVLSTTIIATTTASTQTVAILSSNTTSSAVTLHPNPQTTPKKSTPILIPSSPVPTSTNQPTQTFSLSPARPIRLLEKPRIADKVPQSSASAASGPVLSNPLAPPHPPANGHLPIGTPLEPSASPRKLVIEQSPQKSIGPPSQQQKHASPMRKLAFDSLQPQVITPVKSLFDPQLPHASPLKTVPHHFDSHDSVPRKLSVSSQGPQYDTSKSLSQMLPFEPKIQLKTTSLFEPTTKTIPSLKHFDPHFLPDNNPSTSRRNSLAWSDQSQTEDDNARFLDKKVTKSRSSDEQDRPSFNFFNSQPPPFVFNPNFIQVTRNTVPPQAVMQQTSLHPHVPPHLHPVHPSLHHSSHLQQLPLPPQRHTITSHVNSYWPPDQEGPWQSPEFSPPASWEHAPGWEESPTQHFRPPIPHFRPPPPQHASHMQHPGPQPYRHQPEATFDLSNNPYLQSVAQHGGGNEQNFSRSSSPYSYATPQVPLVHPNKGFTSQFPSHMAYGSQGQFPPPAVSGHAVSSDTHASFNTAPHHLSAVSSSALRSTSQPAMSVARSLSTPTPPPAVPIVAPRKLPSIPTLGSLPGAYGSTFNSSIWGQNQTSVLNKDGWDFSTSDSTQSKPSAKLTDPKDSPIW